MNRCIYCKKDDSETTFTTRDHIVPRNIGGLNRLPIGVVCDGCNNYFSVLEKRFIYDSPIALPKQFQGPAGRSGPYKSNLHVLLDRASGAPSLGYIEQGGKPYTAPQCQILVGDKCQFVFCGSSSEQIASIISEFSKKCREVPDADVIFIKSEKINKNCPILANYKNKLIAGIQDETDKVTVLKLKANLGAHEPQYQPGNTSSTVSHVTSNQNLAFSSDEFYRVIGKTILNTIAADYSHDIALSPKFDDLRNYVRFNIKLDGFEFISLIDKSQGDFCLKRLAQSLHLPAHSHIQVCGDLYSPQNIIGISSLYDQTFEFVVRLNKAVGDIFQDIPFRMHVVDYESKNEYEFLSRMVADCKRQEKLRKQTDGE